MLPCLNVQRTNYAIISSIARPLVVVHPIIGALLELLLLLLLLLVHLTYTIHYIQLVAILLRLLIGLLLTGYIHGFGEVDLWLVHLVLVKVFVLLVHHTPLLLPVTLHLAPQAWLPVGLLHSCAILLLAACKLMLELMRRGCLIYCLARFLR